MMQLTILQEEVTPAKKRKMNNKWKVSTLIWKTTIISGIQCV